MLGQLDRQLREQAEAGTGTPRPASATLYATDQTVHDTPEAAGGACPVFKSVTMIEELEAVEGGWCREDEVQHAHVRLSMHQWGAACKHEVEHAPMGCCMQT